MLLLDCSPQVCDGKFLRGSPITASLLNSQCAAAPTRHAGPTSSCLCLLPAQCSLAQALSTARAHRAMRTIHHMNCAVDALPGFPACAWCQSWRGHPTSVPLLCPCAMQVLGKNHKIKCLEKCDFQPMADWADADREAKKLLSKEVRGCGAQLTIACATHCPLASFLLCKIVASRACKPWFLCKPGCMQSRMQVQ